MSGASLPWALLLRVMTAAGLKFAGAAAGLVATLIMARAMSLEDMGLVAFLTSLVSMLVIVALCGHEAVVIRETAAYRAREDFEQLAGLWCWAGLATLIASIAIAAIAFAVVAAIGLPAGHLPLYGIAFLGLPLIVMGRIGGAMLQGGGRVIVGDFLGQAAGQVLFCVALAAVVLWPLPVEAQQVIAIRFWTLVVVAIIATLCILRLFLRRLAAVKRQYHAHQWFREAMPFAILSGVLILMSETDLFAVKLLLGDAAAGLYRPPQRIVWVIAFGMMAVNTLMQPRIAALHATGDQIALQRTVTKATRLGIAMTVPLTALVVLLAEPLLGLFGEAYRDGAWALRILAIGHLVNVAAGPVAMLLNMSRLQFVALRQTSLALILNVGLAILLVPVLGIDGAAVATAVAMCAWNALLWRQVRRHLGIRPTIFARMRASEVDAGPLRPAAA